jgi:hypothetical protein
MQAILFQVDRTLCFYNQFCEQVYCCLVALSMGSVKEQRICVKFCFRVGKTAGETHRMLREANSDNALSQTTTVEWFRRFKNGQTSTDGI